METIIFEGMDKLLPPIEQAKMIGLIREPEQLQHNKKQNYILYGMSIACMLLISAFLIQNIIQKNNQKKKQELNL